jgi:hypothetical protein
MKISKVSAYGFNSAIGVRAKPNFKRNRYKSFVELFQKLFAITTWRWGAGVS